MSARMRHGPNSTSVPTAHRPESLPPRASWTHYGQWPCLARTRNLRIFASHYPTGASERRVIDRDGNRESRGGAAKSLGQRRPQIIQPIGFGQYPKALVRHVEMRDRKSVV